MTITVWPVTPTFAAEIGDIDLSQQIAPTDYLAIEEAFAKYAVLIFPDQHLSQDQHLDFARHFGPLDVSIGVHRKDTPLRVREELTDVSNLDFKNEIWGKESRRRGFQLGARMWHTDNSFKRVTVATSPITLMGPLNHVGIVGRSQVLSATSSRSPAATSLVRGRQYAAQFADACVGGL